MAAVIPPSPPPCFSSDSSAAPAALPAPRELRPFSSPFLQELARKLSLQRVQPSKSTLPRLFRSISDGPGLQTGQPRPVSPTPSSNSHEEGASTHSNAAVPASPTLSVHSTTASRTETQSPSITISDFFFPDEEEVPPQTHDAGSTENRQPKVTISVDMLRWIRDAIPVSPHTIVPPNPQEAYQTAVNAQWATRFSSQLP